MYEQFLSDFAAELGLEGGALSALPFGFTLDNRVHFNLQENEEGLCLVLDAPLPPYAEEQLLKAFACAGYLKGGAVFAVGFARDKLYLMHQLNVLAGADEASSAVKTLLRVYDQLSGA
ncbi:MAG: hypothetical protein IAB19_08035 [Proteobacteria bacterium]|uniref:Uncharacterized protein n=1 Tax=Candidatus Avisuccinivibrio stercorigallinarum TaxID=2840704 RepID=A0A9D9DF96_9GAMM|nr:hypothetical protein [Candidatus Avisuccinivibrio stercorigallinarum]